MGGSVCDLQLKLESHSNLKLHEFPPGPLHPPSFAVAKDKQGLGQQQLLNVLRAYSIFNAEVGYCKGLRKPPVTNANQEYAQESTPTNTAMTTTTTKPPPSRNAHTFETDAKTHSRTNYWDRIKWYELHLCKMCKALPCDKLWTLWFEVKVWVSFVVFCWCTWVKMMRCWHVADHSKLHCLWRWKVLLSHFLDSKDLTVNVLTCLDVINCLLDSLPGFPHAHILAWKLSNGWSIHVEHPVTET